MCIGRKTRVRQLRIKQSETILLVVATKRKY